MESRCLLSGAAVPAAAVLVPAVVTITTPAFGFATNAGNATTAPTAALALAPASAPGAFQLTVIPFSNNSGAAAGRGTAFAIVDLMTNVNGLNGAGSSLRFNLGAGSGDTFGGLSSDRSDLSTVITIIPVSFLTPTTSTSTSASTTTQSPTAIQTQPVAVVEVSRSGGGAFSPLFFLLVGPINPSPLSATSDTATATAIHAPPHTAPASSIPGLSSISILAAPPTMGVRPPQPLDLHPEIDRDLLLRLHEEEDPYGAPNELDPVSGYEFVGRDQEERLFDVFAIARRVREMGVVDDGQALAEHSPATPQGVPLVTDLNARESNPTIDPVLTGVVVALGSSLALRPDRSGDRRRRLPWPSPSRSPWPTR